VQFSDTHRLAVSDAAAAEALRGAEAACFGRLSGGYLARKGRFSRCGGALERGKTLGFSANSAIERYPGTKNSISDINRS
jgi:hypothetical protein